MENVSKREGKKEQEARTVDKEEGEVIRRAKEEKE